MLHNKFACKEIIITQLQRWRDCLAYLTEQRRNQILYHAKFNSRRQHIFVSESSDDTNQKKFLEFRINNNNNQFY